MFRKLLLALSLSFAIVPTLYAADLTITESDVKSGGEKTVTQNVQFGETVARGDLVYFKAGDAKYWKTDNDASTTDNIAGVVLSGNAANGYGIIVISGPIAVGNVVTVGMNYMASSNAGKIMPVADIASGDYISSVGHSTSTGVIWVAIKNYELAKP